MKKLIKADLSAILRLAGESRFLAADSLDPCIAKLCRQEYTDFSLPGPTPWCCIFGFPTYMRAAATPISVRWPVAAPPAERSPLCSSTSTRL